MSGIKCYLCLEKDRNGEFSETGFEVKFTAANEHCSVRGRSARTADLVKEVARRSRSGTRRRALSRILAPQPFSFLFSLFTSSHCGRPSCGVLFIHLSRAALFDFLKRENRKETDRCSWVRASRVFCLPKNELRFVGRHTEV